MRKVLSYLAVVLSLIFLAGDFAFAASNLEEGVKQLADQISKNMLDKNKQKIAIIDFSDLNGNVTALGQFMAEELTTQLFIIAPGKFEVVERRQLLKLEQELALGQMGFIEEKGIKKMGQVLGVDAIVTGSMTDLGNSVKINARLIGVDTAKVFAVAATDIPKTGMVADLIGKQAEGKKASALEEKSNTSPPAKPKALVKAEVRDYYRDITLEARECKVKGQRISCTIAVVNNAPNIIHFWLWTHDSILIDDFGNQYQPYKAGFLKKDQYSDSENIPPDLPINFSLIYNDVPPTTYVTVVVKIRGDSTATAVLRNIPLSR